MPVKAGQARCLTGHPTSVAAGEPRGSDVPSEHALGVPVPSEEGRRLCLQVSSMRRDQYLRATLIVRLIPRPSTRGPSASLWWPRPPVCVAAPPLVGRFGCPC